jgi:hypothetical protein
MSSGRAQNPRFGMNQVEAADDGGAPRFRELVSGGEGTGASPERRRRRPASADGRGQRRESGLEEELKEEGVLEMRKLTTNVMEFSDGPSGDGGGQNRRRNTAVEGGNPRICR